MLRKEIVERCLIVGVGGSLGALTRGLTGQIVTQIFGSSFPWGTLIANLFGTFLLSLILSLALVLRDMDPRLKLGLTTGFLGSYTTFSTIALDLHILSQGLTFIKPILYLFLSFGGGLLAAIVGYYLGLKYGVRKVKSPEGEGLS